VALRAPIYAFAVIPVSNSVLRVNTLSITMWS
jgi:hypothetical protein